MVTTESAVERFLAAPLLAEASPEARRAVLAVLEERRAPAGTVLLEQGRRNERLAFLIDGTATIGRDAPGRRTETLATLTAPSVIGTTSFFRRVPSIVTVRAASDVWLLTLDHDAHDRLRAANPGAAEQLALAAVRVLAEHFDLLDRRVSDDLAQPEEPRRRASEWAGFRARLFERSAI